MLARAGIEAAGAAHARSAPARPPTPAADAVGDAAFPAALRLGPDDLLGRTLARAVEQRAAAPAALLQRYRGDSQWGQKVAAFEAAYEKLPATLQVPDHLELRLAQLEQFAGGNELEDYSATILGRIGATLRSLAQVLPGQDDLRAPIAERVTDLLVTTCLVVARGGHRRIEVITPSTLKIQLDRLVWQLGSGMSLKQTEIGSVSQGRTLGEDMLLLNLINLAPEVREAVQDSPLFQAIRASALVTDVMLAASGHEEQRYLSTCGIASRDQEVLSKVGSIAGLIVVSRRVFARVQELVVRNAAALQSRTAPQLVDKKQRESVYALCVRTIRAALHDLAAIEADALAIVRAPGTSAARDLQQLTERWGRLMQANMGVLAGPAADPRAGISILTPKVFDGLWLASAAWTTVTEGIQITWRGEAEGRQEPPDEDSYRSMLRDEVGLVGPAADQTINKTVTAWKQGPALQNLWEGTMWRGGVPLSVPGHALFLKAVRHDGSNAFLLSDPKDSSYTSMTPAALAAWLGGKQISLPFDPFSGS